MTGSPFPVDGWRDSRTRRMLIIAAAVILIAAALTLLIGPANVLVLLHLKDLETEPPADRVPNAPVIMTVEQLRARVMNTRPRLESFLEFPDAEQEIAGMRFLFFAVETGFEVEFQLDGDAIRSVTLYRTEDKQDRLSLTNGVTPAVFDLFVGQP